MVETSRRITPNQKERIEEIEGVAKTGKITTADRDKLIKKLSRKPSVFLVYLVLRKHFSAENTMSRQDIEDKIEQDYGVSINSLDTITNSINEIGYIKTTTLNQMASI